MGILRQVADIRGNGARLPPEIITIRGKNVDVKKKSVEGNKQQASAEKKTLAHKIEYSKRVDSPAAAPRRPLFTAEVGAWLHAYCLLGRLDLWKGMIELRQPFAQRAATDRFAYQ